MSAPNFSAVERASRYIGGEVGSRIKDPAGVDVRMGLCFPDLYEIGMSSTGFQILYHIANERPRTYAERVFAPWPDYAEELGRAGDALRTLETKTPLRDLDVVLFSIQYELACTNVVRTLDLAGIPRRADNRGPDDPLIVAGGHCASNPEPWAAFFDALVIGDGEDVLEEILACLEQLKTASRSERLVALGGIEGLYLPSNYKPLYRHGRFDGFEKKPGVTPTKRRIVANLDSVPHPTCPVLPNTRLVHDRLSVEIMRGCTRGCRFCQPGFLTRPLRERSVDNLMNIIEQGLDDTGHDEMTLLSLSSGDYSRLADVIDRVPRAANGRTVSVSLPSLRAESITEDVMERLAKVRRGGFTIAPEAGSERLRRVLNKPMTDEQIFSACRTAADKGWHLVKLYFMVGLPTETEEDLDAIVDLCFAVLDVMKAKSRRAQVNVNVGTFVPKPFTPFTWEPQLPWQEARERFNYLLRRTRGTRVHMKPHDPRMSYLEGLLGRGDRRLADVIERVVDTGGGFDGWTDHFNLDRWMSAFRDAGLDPDRYIAGIPENAPLPWDGVDALIDKEFLLNERHIAHEEAATEDCRWAKCTWCGSCDFKVVKNRLASDPGAAQAPRPAAPAMAEPITFRYRVRYGKVRAMRFLGHLEMASIIHRALHRAGLRLDYTKGFHRQPKVAFGPPLATGIESEDEYFDMVLTEHVDSAAIHTRLRETFPSDLPVFEIAQIGAKDAQIFQAIESLRFVASLRNGHSLDAGEIGAALRRFHAADDMEYRYERKGKERVVDVKQVVKEAAFTPEGEIALTLRFLPTGSLSPFKALAVLLDVDEQTARNAAWRKDKTLFAVL